MALTEEEKQRLQAQMEALSKMRGSGTPIDPMKPLIGTGYDIASKVTDNPYLGTALATGIDAFPMALGALSGHAPGQASIEAAPELDMSLAARMARAKEMGFNPEQTYYHGTPSSFKEFRPREEGTFFTDDPKFAGGFSELPGLRGRPENASPNIIPVKLKTQNTFDTENPEHLDMVINALEKRTAQLEPGQAATNIRALNEMKNIREKYDPYSLARRDNWTTLENPHTIQSLKDLGFDSYLVNEGGRRNIAVFNPNQVRSINAKFDPSQAASSDLLSARIPMSSDNKFSNLQNLINPSEDEEEKEE